MRGCNPIYKLNNGVHLNQQHNKFNRYNKLQRWMIVQWIKQHKSELILNIPFLIRSQEQLRAQALLE